MSVSSLSASHVLQRPKTACTANPPIHSAVGDSVHFAGKTKAAPSPLAVADSHQRYLDNMTALLAPFSGPDYVQSLDEAKRPPLEVFDAITNANQFIVSVPVPPLADAQTLLRNPDFMREFTHAMPKGKLPAFERLPLEDAGTRQLLDHVSEDGHAKAQALSAIELVKRTSVGVATFLGVNSGLAAEAIGKIGTPAQRAFWLNALNKGLYSTGFALTESNVGSDPISMETTYKELPDGSFELNGNKKFIGNAARVTDADGNVVHPGADFLVVFAVDNPAAPPEMRHFKAFMIPRTAIGEENIRPSGGAHNKLGLREVNNGDFDLKGTIVPKEFALGEPGENIYDKLMGALDETRLMVGCMGLGTAEASLDAATQYTGQRRQKGNAIERYQLVSFPLKKLLAKQEATRLLIMDAADKVDLAASQRARGDDPYVFKTETAMSKYYGTELGFEAVHQAIRALGGRGYMEDPAEGKGLAKRARDAEITRIYEGTNEIQQNLIAQGVIVRTRKQLKSLGPLQGPLLLARQRKAAAILTKPGIALADPLTVLDAATDYATVDVMRRGMTEAKKPWDATPYQGWDERSVARQMGFDKSLPIQQRLGLLAQIATLAHMAHLSSDEIARIDANKNATPEDTVRKQKLELFINIAAEESVAKINELRGPALKQLEKDYRAQHA